MSLWQAPDEIRRLVYEIRDDHHLHLSNASLWVLVSDTKGIRDNKVIATQTRRCTSSEKLATGHDFKIIVVAETWSNLTDEQRKIAIDEALCRCGVQYVPETMEVNGKRVPVKDELGRIVYTDEIAYDREGAPKWKLNKPDVELFYGLLMRHGKYSEDVDNAARVLEGKPVMQPTIAVRKDKIKGEVAALS